MHYLKLIGRVAFGLLAVVVAFQIGSLLGDLSGGVAMAATGTVVSNLGETNTPDAHKVRDVSDALSVLEPSRFPFDTMMRRLKGRRSKSKAILVEWEATDRLPRTDTANGAQVAGAAGAAVDVDVTNATYWRKNDLVALPQNAADEILLVQSVDSGAGTINVVALAAAGFGTVPALADGEVLARIGNSKTERDDASDSRIIVPADDNNFIHTFDAVVSVSDHRMRTRNHTSTQDWKRARQDNLYDLRKSLEYNYFFGKKSETTDAGNQNQRWTMNGVTRYINQTIDYSIGALTESNLVDINAQIFTGNNGAFTRMLFADATLAGDLDKVLLAKMQHAPTRKIAGVEFTELRTRFGRLLVAYHPGFDELGYEAYGVVLDMNNVEKLELQALEKRVLKLKEQGIDAEAEQYIEKSTVAVKKPDTHFIIQGS